MDFDLNVKHLGDTLYKRVVNETISWVPADSENLFLHNLKGDSHRKDLLSYKKNPIQYKFNNYGFRSPIDFSKGMNGNVFLGCSYTFGIGHYLENTWGWMVNEKIGGNFFNFGIGGAGIGTAARLLYAYKDELKYDNVFLHIPHPYRYEYYHPITEKYGTLSPSFNELPHQKNIITDEVRMILAADNNVLSYYKSNLAWIEKICEEHNARLIIVKDVDYGERYEIWKQWSEKRENRHKVEIARDIGHPGVSYMEEYANRVLAAYNNPNYINFTQPNKNVDPKIFKRELI